MPLQRELTPHGKALEQSRGAPISAILLGHVKAEWHRQLPFVGLSCFGVSGGRSLKVERPPFSPIPPQPYCCAWAVEHLLRRQKTHSRGMRQSYCIGP